MFLLRLVAKFRKGKVVALEDHRRRCYYSIATRNAFGDLTAPVFWDTKLGCCILKPDGTVDPQSEAFYIKRWVYA